MFVYLLSFFPSPIWLSSEFCICRAACRHLCCDTDISSPKTEIAVLQFQSSYAHSLTSALHYLVPVRPRRQIVYPLEKLGINAPSKAVSKAPVGSPAAAGRRHGASSCGCGRWGGSTVFSGAGCFLITGSLALVPLQGCPEEAPLQPFTSGGYFPVSLKQEAQVTDARDSIETPSHAAVSQDRWHGVNLSAYFCLLSPAQKQISPFHHVLLSRQSGHSRLGQG